MQEERKALYQAIQLRERALMRYRRVFIGILVLLIGIPFYVVIIMVLLTKYGLH